MHRLIHYTTGRWERPFCLLREYEAPNRGRRSVMAYVCSYIGTEEVLPDYRDIHHGHPSSRAPITGVQPSKLLGSRSLLALAQVGDAKTSHLIISHSRLILLSTSSSQVLLYDTQLQTTKCYTTQRFVPSPLNKITLRSKIISQQGAR